MKLVSSRLAPASAGMRRFLDSAADSVPAFPPGRARRAVRALCFGLPGGNESDDVDFPVNRVALPTGSWRAPCLQSTANLRQDHLAISSQIYVLVLAPESASSLMQSAVFAGFFSVFAAISAASMTSKGFRARPQFVSGAIAIILFLPALTISTVAAEPDYAAERAAMVRTIVAYAAAEGCRSEGGLVRSRLGVRTRQCRNGDGLYSARSNFLSARRRRSPRLQRSSWPARRFGVRLRSREDVAYTCDGEAGSNAVTASRRRCRNHG